MQSFVEGIQVKTYINYFIVVKKNGVITWRHNMSYDMKY